MAKLTFSFESAQPACSESFPFSFDKDDAVRILMALAGDEASRKAKSMAEYLLDLGSGSSFSFPLESDIVARAELCRETCLINEIDIRPLRQRTALLPVATSSYANELDAVEHVVRLAKTGTVRVAIAAEN